MAALHKEGAHQGVAGRASLSPRHGSRNSDDMGVETQTADGTTGQEDYRAPIQLQDCPHVI